MPGRLRDKVAVVVGAGQTPGATIGNGRAISVLFAREGAKVMLVDCRLDSALETKAMIDREGGESFAFEADVTKTEDCRCIPEKCLEVYGRIDILVNVVGIGEETGDPEAEVGEQEWDRILEVNLKGMYLTCKYILPVMEKQESGAVVNISSAAAVCYAPSLYAYKVAKAGVNALTHHKAMKLASKGVRVNAIMPGLLNTPMAVEASSRVLGRSREEVTRFRDMLVPLNGGMGDAWDTAYAALFLASDEAKFITAAILPVDGGQSGRIQ